MLVQQYFAYLLAKGIPGFINFLGIYFFTRLLSPSEYGNYVLVVSGVCFANAVLFQWIRIGLLRFYPYYENKSNNFLSSLFFIYLIICFVVICSGLTLYILCPGVSKREYIILGTFILCAQSLYEVSLEFNRSKLEVKKYGILAALKAVLSLLVGLILVYCGYGAFGLLLGLLCGYILPTLTQYKFLSNILNVLNTDREVLSRVFKYGVPLTMTFLMEFVISSSDRLILGYMIDPAAAGIYSAGYDLSVQSLGLLMSVVNLAAYPLVIRALNSGGVEKTQHQLSANATLLFGISFPIAVGMILLATNISTVVLGGSFQLEGALLMPWIVFAALIAGIKAFHFDLSFQLGQKTVGQVMVVVLAASINILLNVLLIPRFGIMGAAYATLTAYVVGLVLSYVLGRRVLKVPVPWFEILKIACAIVPMSVALSQLCHLRGVGALILQVSVGFVVYATSAFLLNIGGCKSYILRKVYAKK